MKKMLLLLLAMAAVSLTVQASEKKDAGDAIQRLYDKAIKAGASNGIVMTCPNIWPSRDHERPFFPFYNPNTMYCTSYALQGGSPASGRALPDYKKQILVLGYAVRYFDNPKTNCDALNGVEKEGCVLGYSYARLAGKGSSGK